MRTGDRGDRSFGRGQGRGNRGRNNERTNNNSSQGARPTCQVCGKVEHSALKCYHRFDHAYKIDDGHTASMVTTPSYSVDTNWYTNTGATDHVTADLDRISICEKYPGKEQVQVANGTGLSILHTGHSLISTSSRPLKLRNILHVPNISKNLISVHRFATDSNVFFEFHPTYFLVKDQATRSLLLQGKREGGLYHLPPESTALNKIALSTTKVPQDLWHRRLGYPLLQLFSVFFAKISSWFPQITVTLSFVMLVNKQDVTNYLSLYLLVLHLLL